MEENTTIRKFRGFYKRFFGRGSFSRNFGITLTGNASVFIIQVLLSPVISRIYEPAEYGVFALFAAIATNLSVFGSLRYAQSIVLAEDERERISLIILSIGISVIISVLAFFLLFIFENPIASLFRTGVLNSLIYLVPVWMVFTILIEVFVGLNASKKKFSYNVAAGFVNNLGSRALNIIYGLIEGGKSIGLIIGDFAGKLFCLAVLIFSFSIRSAQIHKLFTYASLESIKAAGRKYKSFPLYYLPSNVITIFSGQLPIYFLQWYSSVASVGIFALATSMLEVFNRVVPYALSPVFLQKADELKKESLEYLSRKTFRLYVVLLVLGTCIFSIIAIFGEMLFHFIFGAEWRLAGTFAAMMAMQYTYGFVAIPLAEVYTIMGKQHILLVNSLVNFVLRVVSVILILYLNVDEVSAIFIFGIMGGIGNLILIIGVFRILEFNQRKAFLFLFLSLVIISGIVVIRIL